VNFGIRAKPPPILGSFGKVESGFWVILLIRRTTRFGDRVIHGLGFVLEGCFAHTIQVDSPIQLARPRPRPSDPPKILGCVRFGLNYSSRRSAVDQ